MFTCESCCGELMSENAFRRLVMPSLQPDEVEVLSGRPDQRHIIVEADGDAGVIERCKALGLTPSEAEQKARQFAKKFWAEQGNPGSEFIFYRSEGERYWTTKETDMSTGPRRADADAMQRPIALVEKFITMSHPASVQDLTSVMRGESERPSYEPAPDGVARVRHPKADGMIIRAASCISGMAKVCLVFSDDKKLSKLAFKAVEHYASIPIVKMFFLMPYTHREKVMQVGSDMPPEEMCRVYAGVENLLLDIAVGLRKGDKITDEKVVARIRELVQSVGGDTRGWDKEEPCGTHLSK